MPEHPVKELSNHRGRSGVPLQGRGAVAFGFVFLAAGGFIILLAADVIHSEDSNFHAPCWLVGVIGGVFAGPGLYISSVGVMALRRRARSQQATLTSADQPWVNDHSWNPAGSRDAMARRVLSSLVLAIFLTGFGAVPLWIGFGPDPSHFVFKIVGVLAGCATLAVWCCTFYRLARWFKYGSTFLRFDTFPFRLGQTVQGSLIHNKGRDFFEAMTLTLRCVQERYETRGTGRNRSTRIVCYQLHAETQTPTQTGDLAGEVPITFSLPHGDFATCLAQRPPRYWEMEVTAKAPGVDYRAVFLVPVY